MIPITDYEPHFTPVVGTQCYGANLCVAGRPDQVLEANSPQCNGESNMEAINPGIIPGPEPLPDPDALPIGTTCYGYDLCVAGRPDQIIEANSPQCGYVASNETLKIIIILIVIAFAFGIIR